MKNERRALRLHPWRRLQAGGHYDVDGSDNSRRAVQTAGQAWCRRNRPDLKCTAYKLPSGKVRVRLVGKGAE